jgi:hypothetical protein
MDFKEAGYEGVDWSNQTQHRNRWWHFVNAVNVLRVPQNEGNLFTGFTRTAPWSCYFVNLRSVAVLLQELRGTITVSIWLVSYVETEE